MEATPGGGREGGAGVGRGEVGAGLARGVLLSPGVEAPRAYDIAVLNHEGRDPGRALSVEQELVEVRVEGHEHLRRWKQPGIRTVWAHRHHLGGKRGVRVTGIELGEDVDLVLVRRPEG